MKDTISSLQTKHQAEIQGLKEVLATTEATNTDLQKEVSGQYLIGTEGSVTIGDVS